MQVDALAVRLRPRAPMEAADLGARLCQSAARSVYRSYAIVRSPVAALALALLRARRLAAAAGAVVRETVARSHDPVRPVARGLRTDGPHRPTCGRRSGRCGGASCCSRGRSGACRSGDRSRSRSTSSKGLSIRKAGRAFARSGARNVGSALMMTHAFSLSETALTIALVSLVFWLAPSGKAAGRTRSGSSAGSPGFLSLSSVGRLRDDGGVSRAVLRRGRVRDVPEPACRARGLGHRAGVSTCVRALTCHARRGGGADSGAVGRVAAAAERSAAPRRRPTPRATLRSRARSRPSRPIRTSRPNGRSRRSAGRRSTEQKRSRTSAWFPWIAGLFRWLDPVGAAARVGRGHGAGCRAARLHRRALMRRHDA